MRYLQFLSLSLLFGLLSYSPAVNGQMDFSLVDTMTAVEKEELRELKRIEELTDFGPHLKNKNAAGRLLILNATAPDINSVPTRIRLTGPAYKNRGGQTFTASGADTAVAAPAPAKRRLTGPRYKNRGAKSGQQ